MKKIMIFLICWPATFCNAQSIDTLDKIATAYFKEAENAAKDQKIWPVNLYGPMMFVDPKSRITYSNKPDSAGILKPYGFIYKGILPNDVLVANTAITWGSTLWSVILWPLPQDHDQRLNLIMHESFHRVQGKIGLPAHSPTADDLSTMNGRIFFLLELQALKAALNKPVNHRNTDLKSALLFRAKRQELFPQSFKNERLLEMNEGLAEYTGVMLGRAKDSVKQHLFDVIEHAADHQSLIRSFPYMTGPVYGYLLYEKAPNWTIKVDSNSSFPSLIAKFYHVGLTKKHINKTKLMALQKKYDSGSIISSEKAKEKTRLEMVESLTDLFTQKPVLAIDLIRMNISFNPNNLFDMGNLGTVYPTGEIRDSWGFLQVKNNGMLMKDWKKVYLPVKSILNLDAHIVEGNGWKLFLEKGWKIIKVDNLHYQLRK